MWGRGGLVRPVGGGGANSPASADAPLCRACSYPATGNLFLGKVSGGLPHTCQRRRGGYGFYEQRHFDMLINLRHHLA